MQVAKFWRRNQLRYRLEGVVQPKAQLNVETETLKVAVEPTKKSDAKVKVA